QVVRLINQRYATAEWQPIRLELRDDMERAIAGYKQFDVLLVNPIYDGMNLVAKEGMTVNRRGGMLVLSENAGTHEELGEWAITINPFEVDATAEALHKALVMDPIERHTRAEKMKAASSVMSSPMYTMVSGANAIVSRCSTWPLSISTGGRSSQTSRPGCSSSPVAEAMSRSTTPRVAPASAGRTVFRKWTLMVAR